MCPSRVHYDEALNSWLDSRSRGARLALAAHQGAQAKVAIERELACHHDALVPTEYRHAELLNLDPEEHPKEVPVRKAALMIVTTAALGLSALVPASASMAQTSSALAA